MRTVPLQKVTMLIFFFSSVLIVLACDLWYYSLSVANLQMAEEVDTPKASSAGGTHTKIRPALSL